MHLGHSSGQKWSLSPKRWELEQNGALGPGGKGSPSLRGFSGLEFKECGWAGKGS